MTTAIATALRTRRLRLVKHSNSVSNDAGRKPAPIPLAFPVPRILCVDDDPDFHTLFQFQLDPYRVELDQAFQGRQGFIEALKKEPDLIIMDLVMPNGSGEFLIDIIKRNPVTSGIPLIVVTGKRDECLKRQLLLAGVSAFLSKPMHESDLIREISRFINLSSK